MRLSPQIIKIRAFLLVSACILFSPSFAQNLSVSGSVLNIKGVPVPYINVFIKTLGKGAVTDDKGKFTISGLSAGNYELTISGIGYETQVIEATAPGKELLIRLEEGNQELDEITIEAKSETQLAAERPIKSAVINTRIFSQQPSTMIELMNRSAGIRVRQTGGLGSNANVLVNGFQDRAIKYFKDGIPMDYLGAGYNFSLVPVNMLERLEIYKGVLPASLGADALGGGINMVTKKSFLKHAEASYEMASFNTHRFSLNVFHKDTARNFFAGADAFFNYSDNNYKVTAPVIDSELGTQQEEEVKLFHNNFTHYYAEAYGGFVNTKWADELRIGVTGFLIDRDNQYGSRMTQPFGASTSRQYSIVPTLRYGKTFFDERLAIDQFLVANTITVEQVDTARGTYNWHGEFLPSDSRRGEVSVRGSLAKTKFSIFTSRTNLAYRLNDNNKVEFNAVHTALKRVGRDPLGLTFVASGRDILSVPAHYDKSVFSLGLESRFLDEKLTNNLIVKYYQYKTEAIDGDYYGNEMNRSGSNQRWGLANAAKFLLGERSFIRLSAEAATRLPEQDEIFGDGNLHVSNFELKPERSININAGYKTTKGNKYTVELNSFYRITRDLILNVPYNFLFNQHQNVDNVKGIGFETDVSFAILQWLNANANFTYQDFRLFETGNAMKEKARLRNTPYFFTNLGLTASGQRVFSGKDKLEVYWYYTFVREYYLDYIPKDKEPGGFLGLWGKAKIDAPNVIPDQNVHTAGLTYFPFDNKFSLGFQVKNALDAKIYDNFRIQNAGRSFHVKLTYILK